MKLSQVEELITRMRPKVDIWDQARAQLADTRSRGPRERIKAVLRDISTIVEDVIELKDTEELLWDQAIRCEQHARRYDARPLFETIDELRVRRTTRRLYQVKVGAYLDAIALFRVGVGRGPSSIPSHAKIDVREEFKGRCAELFGSSKEEGGT